MHHLHPESREMESYYQKKIALKQDHLQAGVDKCHITISKGYSNS